MRHRLLNNRDHRDLRVSAKPSALFGDNVNFGLLVPSELKSAQHFYPIVIQKDSTTGKFFFTALFGFQEGENLFLEDAGWNADYIPLSIMRQPFFIGQQTQVVNGEQRVSRVINIDIESPRVGAEDGERLFTDAGENTSYLAMIADILESLHHGLLDADQLLKQLVDYDLLEQFTLKVTFNEYKKYELPDLYTINEDTLKNLADEQIVSLHRSGALEKIYAVLHSQASVSTLIKLKNQQDLN